SAAPGAALAAGLTPRETEVFREVVAGHSNKVIAHRLGISPKTVEMHRARVMKKTGARSVAELVRMSLDAADGAGAGPQAGGAGFSPSG
ncbi:MAG: LuxR C-terminal-related transcriptional regulator, partial [Pseudomonadota bacterium]